MCLSVDAKLYIQIYDFNATDCQISSTFRYLEFCSSLLQTPSPVSYE